MIIKNSLTLKITKKHLDLGFSGPGTMLKLALIIISTRKNWDISAQLIVLYDTINKNK